jgi:hypothetical protein
MNLKKNTKMKIEINNYDDLLEFVKRQDISVNDATEIVCKVLKVVSLFELTRKELIIATHYYINNFSKNNELIHKPLFLNQRSLEFDIKDVFKAYEDNNIEI